MSNCWILANIPRIWLSSSYFPLSNCQYIWYIPFQWKSWYWVSSSSSEYFNIIPVMLSLSLHFVTPVPWNTAFYRIRGIKEPWKGHYFFFLYLCHPLSSQTTHINHPRLFLHPTVVSIRLLCPKETSLLQVGKFSTNDVILHFQGNFWRQNSPIDIASFAGFLSLIKFNYFLCHCRKPRNQLLTLNTWTDWIVSW